MIFTEENAEKQLVELKILETQRDIDEIRSQLNFFERIGVPEETIEYYNTCLTKREILLEKLEEERSMHDHTPEFVD